MDGVKNTSDVLKSGGADQTAESGKQETMETTSEKIELSSNSSDTRRKNSSHDSSSQQQKPGAGPKRKPHRRKQGGARRHNKKWKPYNTLSWQEKKERDEFEEKRACMKREERFAEGHPVAPYNTTQFLMEEHNKTENISPALRDAQNRIDEENARHPRHRDLEDEYYDSPNDEDSYIAKDFTETYDTIHAEHIETMSKADLVRDYMELEIKVEKLEGKLKVYESLNIMEKNVSTDSKQSSLIDSNVRPVFFDQRLKFENDKLKKENSDLKRQIELLRSQNRSPTKLVDDQT